NDLMRYLNEKKIGTRQLFAGNIIRQPYFAKQAYRVVGSLEHTDAIMKNTFWLGVYPGLTEEMLTYTASQLEHFVSVTS
ncbi:MAG: DegT/DnrJ/EryC1/StrS family aminotransferase, partial [Candidatus Peribacteraceae bacterium]|nr:DegT/DnrJ/EryC1/StrS family aminotransferase [Candidatus Peribacteraceae bacterium]